MDRRRVASPAQMRALLDAISSTRRTQGPRLVGLYGCMYYGMLRPSEAVSVLRDECHLPDEGWGRLEFREVRSAAGREWTDDGEVHEARKPKGGPKNAVRRVPTPPELVTLLRKHIDQYGTAPDGRLFRTYRGGIYQPSTLWQVLRKSTPSGVHARSGQFPAGQQALRLPPRRSLLAPQRRRPGGRVGWAQRRDAVPDLRPLHRRRRRAMAQTDGRLPWLAQSPGHDSGASPFPRPDLARCPTPQT